MNAKVFVAAALTAVLSLSGCGKGSGYDGGGSSGGGSVDIGDIGYKGNTDPAAITADNLGAISEESAVLARTLIE